MNPSDSQNRRSALRRAEEAGRDPVSRKELADEGIEVGEPVTMSGQEFLDMLEAEGTDADVSSLTVVMYFEDTPVGDRDEIIDPLCSSLEVAGIGEWNGSGQGSFGDGQFFDVNFIVENLKSAVPFIQKELKKLGAGPRTRIHCSDDTVHSLDTQVLDDDQ